MDTHKNVFSWVKPKMGVIALVKHSLSKSSLEITDELFKEKGVAVVPGEVFNLQKHFRFCYGLPVPKMKEALAHTDEYLEKQTTVMQIAH